MTQMESGEDRTNMGSAPTTDGEVGTRSRGTRLKFRRLLTRAGTDPFDTVSWEKRTAVITNEAGEVIFEQPGVEFPRSWSMIATNVVASKYFHGTVGTADREFSLRQVIGRVTETISRWGRELGYLDSQEDAQAFRDELTHLLLYQMASFNSPVWFNVGIEEKPEKPKSNYAVTGIYMYDATVFEKIRTLVPSARNELEITDVNNAYIREGAMTFSFLDGWWTDAGTFDSLLRATNLVAKTRCSEAAMEFPEAPVPAR